MFFIGQVHLDVVLLCEFRWKQLLGINFIFSVCAASCSSGFTSC